MILNNHLPIAYLATSTIVSSWPGFLNIALPFFATYKQHLKFHNIQIDRRNISLFPVPCYTLCSQNFGDIQFDHQALMSPEYNLWSYFEARPTTFHTWSFLGISFAGRWVGEFAKCPILHHSSLSLPPSHLFLNMKLLIFNSNSSSCRNHIDCH